MKRVFLVLMVIVLVAVGTRYFFQEDGVSIRISVSDEDKRRLITAVKYYMPVQMLETILSDDVEISYRNDIQCVDNMCIAGYVRGNSITLVDNADLVTILHEFIHVYDGKKKFSSTKDFVHLYEKYKDSIVFRFRTDAKDVAYISNSNSEFFAECYAYYLLGDFSCEELEEYFSGITKER